MTCRKNGFVNLLSILAVLMCPVTASAIPTLSFMPSETTQTVGSTFDVSLRITEVSDLYAYQFDLGFDPTILSAVDVFEGPFLGSGGATFFIPGTIDNGTGVISFTANTLVAPIPGVSGNGELVRIRFNAAAPGESALTIFNSLLLDSGLSPIDHSAISGKVTATSAPVPEPSSVVLLCLGFALVHLRNALSARTRLSRSICQASGSDCHIVTTL
jgi:general secretion pathway protein D